MRRSEVGAIVYFKKSRFSGYPEDKPFTVTNIIRKPSGQEVAVLDGHTCSDWGALTDTPCSQMVCGDCKWHRKEARDE